MTPLFDLYGRGACGYATGSPELKAVGPCHAVSNSPITRDRRGKFAGTDRDSRSTGASLIITSKIEAVRRWTPARRVSRFGATFIFGLVATIWTLDAAHSGDFGEWQVQRHTSAMDDSNFANVMVQSEAEGVTLGLNCRKTTGDVAIIWGRFLNGDEIGGVELKDITYRVDQNRPTVASWQVMPDRTTVRALTPEGFIRTIRDSSRLVLQVEPYHEMPLTVVFDTTGLKDALLATSPECDWFVRDILWEQQLEKDKNETLTNSVKTVEPAPFQPWAEDAAIK